MSETERFEMSDNMADTAHTIFTKPLFAMGQPVEGYTKPMINETAARARAGLLNIVSSVTIFILLAHPEWDPIPYVAPLVIFDMFTAATFGLTPLSPTGFIGTLMTMKRPPVWKPTAPKRFAWILGTFMGATCLGFWYVGLPTSWLLSVLGVCFALTWLEGILGFCVGCWLHSLFFGCDSCEIQTQ